MRAKIIPETHFILFLGCCRSELEERSGHSSIVFLTELGRESHHPSSTLNTHKHTRNPPSSGHPLLQTNREVVALHHAEHRAGAAPMAGVLYRGGGGQSQQPPGRLAGGGRFRGNSAAMRSGGRRGQRNCRRSTTSGSGAVTTSLSLLTTLDGHTCLPPPRKLSSSRDRLAGSGGIFPGR